MSYPPPVLIKGRSGAARLRAAILLMTIALVLATCTFSRFMHDGVTRAPSAERLVVDDSGAADADSSAAALPDMAARLPVSIDNPADSAASAQSPPDARQPNRWYYVAALGEGPAAIYSRNGDQWDFAFACTRRTRMIEFIAVNTGSPGDFDQQSIRIGKVRLMMDAIYARDGGGTISTRLPARHPFFNALDGKAPMEVRLLANRRMVLPVGGDVIRLIRECRGLA